VGCAVTPRQLHAITIPRGGEGRGEEVGSGEVGGGDRLNWNFRGPKLLDFGGSFMMIANSDVAGVA
jgi:hypothetical protein